jgi:uncharacterized damage-inducible protein DinB
MTSALTQLKEMYAYMIWADNRIIEAAATVPDEGFRRDQNISAGSIHKLLLHAVGAQWLWLGRWQGDSTRKFPTPDELRTVAAIKARWGEVHQALLAFLNLQTDESVEQRVEYIRNGQPHNNKLLHAMCHAADHGTYHRGQLNSMIKLAGGKPVDVGYVTYCRIQEGQQT